MVPPNPPEPKSESAWAPWRRKFLRAPQKDASSLPPQPDPLPAETPSRLQILALQAVLERCAQVAPRLYAKTGLFAALGLASCWLTMEQPHFGVFALWVLAASDINPWKALTRRNRELEEAVDALAYTEDLHAIGPLAQVLPLRSHASVTAREILSRLLPCLHPADTALLGAQGRAELQRALQQYNVYGYFLGDDPAFATLLRQTLKSLDTPLSEEGISREDLTMPRDAILDEMLQRFQAAVTQRRKNNVNATLSAALTAGIAVGNLFFTIKHTESPLILIAIGSLVVTLTLSSRGLLRLKQLMDDLANVGDLRLAGPLLESAVTEEGSTRKMAMQILTRLLPRFRASDAQLLSDAQHVALLRTLSRLDNTSEYMRAALKALEQIGDLRALPLVESLAEGRRIVADHPKRVQVAAQDCLPFLQIRCDQQRASQTLLRASGPAEMPSSTLLRPAQETGATESVELLRAGVFPPESNS